AYEDSEAGGPEHAVVALSDHNIGITKDAFVGGPAELILYRIREMCAADEFTWFREEDPARLRAEVSRHLSVTDELRELPGRGALATDRALVGARLALLPDTPVAPVEEAADPIPAEQRTALVREFLASPAAMRFRLHDVPEADLASLHFCLSLVFDHAASLPDADPMRWSPAVAELFLLDWVHRRAVLDMDDA